ncbi:enoyl-CoA hydratase-related protein [Variovorax sp. PBL-E5]|uniref:enoyl-CoA hydratase-related protein n=1 Tax=Variovorax sp. PBL-E5 TaxID=434014 RepID=UPI001319A3DE|nr:enoyl-CoA hydratase-related protein [Variovorax sp. PBL-E5]VTU39977.1 2,3-dehydroadipyl-CoA hydratase [Variovorax sp. PBL-E5]
MTESDTSAVLCERLPGHVALVTLNRPAARNAINGAVVAALGRAVTALDADDDVRAVVLTGAGSVFSAGADLKEVAAGRASQLRDGNGFAGFVHAPRRKPWIAALNGRALAGGCEIALACDLIVAEEGAALGLPEVTRGLAAAGGGLYRLVQSLPARVAIELILTGSEIDARRAFELGLLNALAPAGQAIARALELARRIAANAPLAVRESLRVARLAMETDADAMRGLSAELWDRIGASADAIEGSRAFVEKRPPRWTGR